MYTWPTKMYLKVWLYAQAEQNIVLIVVLPNTMIWNGHLGLSVENIDILVGLGIKFHIDSF